MTTDYITGVISANNAPAIWDDAFYGDPITDYDFAAKEGHYNPDADDDYEIDECTYYIGFKWAEDKEHIEEDENAEFSAILSTLGGAYIVQVTRSKHTATVNSMCSPCLPGQADIDSGEGTNWDCYTLPPEYFDN